jgi:hypothetical protein
VLSVHLLPWPTGPAKLGRHLSAGPISVLESCPDSVMPHPHVPYVDMVRDADGGD